MGFRFQIQYRAIQNSNAGGTFPGNHQLGIGLNAVCFFLIFQQSKSIQMDLLFFFLFGGHIATPILNKKPKNGFIDAVEPNKMNPQKKPIRIRF